jgi:hypothetical protein
MIEKICPICGKSVNEFIKGAICYKYHNWQARWRKDKTSEKYKIYLERRKTSMELAARRRLDKLNKQTPQKYKSRKSNK